MTHSYLPYGTSYCMSGDFCIEKLSCDNYSHVLAYSENWSCCRPTMTVSGKCKYLPTNSGLLLRTSVHHVLDVLLPHLEPLRSLEQYLRRYFHLESGWKSIVESSEPATSHELCSNVYTRVRYHNLSTFLSIHKLLRVIIFRI